MPTVVITGLGDPSLENELREAGFGYLAKPFAPIKLFNSITEVLDPVRSLERHLAPFPMVVNSNVFLRLHWPAIQHTTAPFILEAHSRSIFDPNDSAD